jgi:hypothetical protein
MVSLRVIVPRIAGHNPGPAEQALQTQNILYETRPVAGGREYGDMIAELWAERRGFILIEHDIVPTPGAIYRLSVCKHPWCAHPYPSPRLMIGLGVTKLTAAALRVSQELPEAWQGEHWGLVDTKLIPALLASFPLHGHLPPFEHRKP